MLFGDLHTQGFMKSKTMPFDKPTVDRKILSQHGITFSEKLYCPSDGINSSNSKEGILVPEHVKCIRETLLDFDIQAPDSLRYLFQDEQQSLQSDSNGDLSLNDMVVPPKSIFISPPNNPTQARLREIEALEDQIEKVARLSQTARQYVSEIASQEKWAHFLHSHIFRDFEKSNTQSNEHDKLLDTWYLENNVAWNAAPKPFSETQEVPRPNFTYGFPIHSPDVGYTPTGLERHDYVTNFSVSALKDLQSIVSCPIVSPSALMTKIAEGSKPKRSDLICFPWAVVELQPKEQDEACHCQAAKGASVALSMLEQLYRRASKVTNIDAIKIPPVVSFTCVGPDVRVWLSFSKPKKFGYKHKMICIWAGTLASTWSIMTLRQIVQNMTYWATRVLKPDISSRIGQIQLASSSLSEFLRVSSPYKKVKLQKDQVRLSIRVHLPTATTQSNSIPTASPGMDSSQPTTSALNTDSDDKDKENSNHHHRLNNTDNIPKNSIIKERRINRPTGRFSLSKNKMNSPTPTSAASPPGQETSFPKEDIEDQMFYALQIISGERFLELAGIEMFLEKLTGVDLLDAIWRALEAWESHSQAGPESDMALPFRMHMLANLFNDFLHNHSIAMENFDYRDFQETRRWADLDRTLRLMQNVGEGKLRDILRFTLKGWKGGKCMEILGEDLLKINADEFDDMQVEAFRAFLF